MVFLSGQPSSGFSGGSGKNQGFRNSRLLPHLSGKNIETSRR
jgi:hypothetical protein